MNGMSLTAVISAASHFFLFSRLALPAQHIQRDEDDGRAEDECWRNRRAP